MQYLQTVGGVAAMALIFLVAFALTLRAIINRTERRGMYWYSHEHPVRDADKRHRSADDRNQPDNELPPLPFRD